MRGQAFAKFADALEAALVDAPDDPARAQRTGEAYYRFAMKNPHAYRIMFDINAPIDDSHPDLGPQADRAAKYITRTAENLVKAGVIDVDPTMFGYAMWAAARAGDVAAGRHAGTCSRLPDAGALPRRADVEGSGAGEENGKEAMTAGVTAGERFRSWADIQANACARCQRALPPSGSAVDDSVALMLRNDFPTFEVNMAAGQLGVYAVPINWHFTPEEAGYILADSGAKVLVARSDLLAQIAGGVPANVKVLVVPTPEEIAAAYNVPAEKRSARRASRPGMLSSSAMRRTPSRPRRRAAA